MKHAYLIIAHHEFEILALLLKTLDDARNDIFIHFDQSIADLPVLSTRYAGLYVLEERIEVSWGDFSQIETEMLLFQEAMNHQCYAYYHVLSGVDLPLKSQDEIHEFFLKYQGKEFIGINQADHAAEIDRKVQRYHLFPKSFRAQPGVLNAWRKVLRSVFLRLQIITGFRRNEGLLFKKGPNWVSVTGDFVDYLWSQKAGIMNNYRHTFCADEIFLQTICWNSPFREKLFDADNEARGAMRMIGWKEDQVVDWKDEDFDLLMNSTALFARKFNMEQLGVVNRIVERIIPEQAAVHQPLVSVIIPVYNAADHIGVALMSLANQTYKALELILINDCSTDDSLSVIAHYLPVIGDMGISVRLINGECNVGVAAARNKGLEAAIGEFIYYVDADDRIEANAIMLLVNEAIAKDADIVGCNWFLSFSENERTMSQAAFSTPLEGIQNMLKGVMRWNLWLFMVRRSLYVRNKIEFMPGMNMGEDLMVMMKLFIAASRVAYIDHALYHYAQTNEQSMTRIYSDAHIDQVSVQVKIVEHCLLESRYNTQLDNGIDFLKLNIKLPLLISDQELQYQKWLNWFPESNSKVLANKSLAFRTRLLQWLALKGQNWALKLYYNVFIKVVYGKIYK